MYSFILDANDDGVLDVLVVSDDSSGISLSIYLNKLIAKSDAFFLTVNMNNYTPGLSFRCVVTDLNEVKSNRQSVQ